MTAPRPPSEVDGLLTMTPHLDDDGFTAGVMARLPEPRRGRWRLRGAILAVSLIGSLVVLVTLPGPAVALAGIRDVLEALLALPVDPARSAAALASVGTTAILVHGTVLALIVWAAVALARERI